MKLRDKIILGVSLFALFCWLIHLIAPVLTPFICSLIIAYFLDPLVDYLVKKKISRFHASFLIVALFLTCFAFICILLAPIIYSQLFALVEMMPQYFENFVATIYPKLIGASTKFGIDLEPAIQDLLSQNFAARAVSISQSVFDNALSSSLSLINILSLIFITPILIFYFLKDWDILVKKVHDYLPHQVAGEAKIIAKEINKTLSGYVRGQFNVCLVLGIFYSFFLTISGLNFGFLIGLLTGLFSFIPFVGMLSGVVVAIIIALFQWGFDLTQIGIVLAIFISGQLIEGNFLTPNLIGQKVGLHPVWIIFGLFVFGVLFGFVGILLSVPLTAICGVIFKHLASKYKKRFV